MKLITIVVVIAAALLAGIDAVVVPMGRNWSCMFQPWPSLCGHMAPILVQSQIGVSLATVASIAWPFLRCHPN